MKECKGTLVFQQELHNDTDVYKCNVCGEYYSCKVLNHGNKCSTYIKPIEKAEPKINVDEILENVGTIKSPVSGLETYLKANVKQAMKEFAEKLLKIAAENANSQCEYGQTNYCGDCDTHLVNKQSITSIINQIEF
jgi:hypothetical protein